MKNHLPLNNLKGKVGQKEFEVCSSCTNVIEKDGEKYCTDRKCRANKKRSFTRKQNIQIRSKWREIEIRLSDMDIYTSSIFPYLLLEVLITINYDEEITELIGAKLGVKKRGFKKQGIEKVYRLESSKVKKLIEIVVLKMSGIKRAEQIIKNIEGKG